MEIDPIPKGTAAVANAKMKETFVIEIKLDPKYPLLIIKNSLGPGEEKNGKDEAEGAPMLS